MAIAELTGLSWGAINAAIKVYGAGGLDALRPKARWWMTGTKKLLSPEQEAEVRRLKRMVAYFGDPKVNYAANHK